MGASFVVKEEIIKEAGETAAIFFSRVDYWTKYYGHNHQNNKWIYNSVESWQKQFSYWSISKIRRTIDCLVQKKLLLKKKIHAKQGNHVMWYAINHTRLQELFVTSPSNKTETNKKSLAKENQYHYNSFNDQPSTKKRANGFDDSEQILKQKKTISNINSSSNVNLEEKNTIASESRFQFSEDEIFKLKDIWKKIFSKGTLPCSLTKPRIQQLASVWESQFDRSFERWEEFCNNICSSKFLMGEKTSFKANLTWLLKDDTIMRIFDKEFGVGDRRTDCEEIAFEATLKSRAELEVKKKIEASHKAQQEHSKREVLREKMTFLDTLSSDEKAELSEAFSDSEFYQEKLSEWRDELSQSELGKMHLSSNPLPSSHIRKIWLQEFAYVAKAPKDEGHLNDLLPTHVP